MPEYPDWLWEDYLSQQKQDEFYASVSKKQFEKPEGYPKPYQKRSVNGQMKFDDVDLPYSEAISKEKSYALRYKEHMQRVRAWNQKHNLPSVTYNGLEEFYWGKLVQLGWKFDRQKDRFVLVCDECDEAINEVYFKDCTDSETISNISNQVIIENFIDSHKKKSHTKRLGN